MVFNTPPPSSSRDIREMKLFVKLCMELKVSCIHLTQGELEQTAANITLHGKQAFLSLISVIGRRLRPINEKMLNHTTSGRVNRNTLTREIISIHTYIHNHCPSPYLFFNFSVLIIFITDSISFEIMNYWKIDFLA